MNLNQTQVGGRDVKRKFKTSKLARVTFNYFFNTAWKSHIISWIVTELIQNDRELEVIQWRFKIAK